MAPRDGLGPRHSLRPAQVVSVNARLAQGSFDWRDTQKNRPGAVPRYFGEMMNGLTMVGGLTGCHTFQAFGASMVGRARRTPRGGPFFCMRATAQSGVALVVPRTGSGQVTRQFGSSGCTDAPNSKAAQVHGPPERLGKGYSPHVASFSAGKTQVLAAWILHMTVACRYSWAVLVALRGR